MFIFHVLFRVYASGLHSRCIFTVYTFLVSYSMFYMSGFILQVLYVRLYIPCFIFHGVYSGLIFQVYTPGFSPRFVYSRLWVYIIFKVFYSRLYVPSFRFQAWYSKCDIPCSYSRFLFQICIPCFIFQVYIPGLSIPGCIFQAASELTVVGRSALPELLEAAEETKRCMAP